MLLTSNKLLRQLQGFLETANWLTLKLMIKNPGALRVFPGRVYRTYMSLARDVQWKSRQIFEILPDLSNVRIVLEHLPGEGIDTPLDELAYLALLTKHLQPKQIFEIGTFRGRTALNFALNAPEDCAIYTLDLSPEERAQFIQQEHPGLADTRIIEESETGIDYQGRDEARRIVQLLGDSTKFDFSPYAERMDLVFVDGAHHYAAVKSDTENALRMVKPGGMIVWHDWANYGDYNDVIRAVLSLLPGEEIIQIENTQLALYRHPAS